MLLKGNLPPKINSYDNILPRSYLLYIFEFQLVLLAFSLILGDTFMVSPHPQVYFSWRTNLVGKIYRGIVLNGGTNDHIIPREKDFHKMHFPVI